jgi:hypothetical protein
VSARILVFPQKALVRTRALRLEKQRKEQRDLRPKALVRTELKSKKEQQAQSVQERTKAEKRNAHAREAGSGTAKYLKTQFRNDLKAAGSEWPAFALQLWSALHPDPSSRKAARPLADVWRYTEALLDRIAAQQFRAPPSVAQARRDQARKERRRASVAKCAEARRLAHVAASLARGEYPGHG